LKEMRAAAARESLTFLMAILTGTLAIGCMWAGHRRQPL
jgi:hypothetical protein